MTTLLSFLAVAFAAFCVWLTVRIVNRRERWAKWTLAAVVGFPAIYIASFGPACWIVSRTGNPPPTPSGDRSMFDIVYQPLTMTFPDPGSYVKPSGRFGQALQWYTRLGSKESWDWSYSYFKRKVEWHWSGFEEDETGEAGDIAPPPSEE